MIKSSISTQSVHEALSRFIVLLVLSVFQPLQGISIGKLRIDLDCSLETRNRLVVLMLTSKRVSYHTPSLRCKPVEVNHLVCKESEFDLFTEMKQNGGK